MLHERDGFVATPPFRGVSERAFQAVRVPGNNEERESGEPGWRLPLQVALEKPLSGFREESLAAGGPSLSRMGFVSFRLRAVTQLPAFHRAPQTGSSHGCDR